MFDHDLWWHLAAGRTMVENHVFLRHENFSHTLSGAPWINFEWLSQIFLYVLVKLGGLKTILYGKVLFSILILLLFARLLRAWGARDPALLLLMVTAFYVMRPRLYERVELVTLFFLPLFVWVLASLRRVSSSTAKAIPWFLFLSMVLWCNLHGGFVYGIGAAILMNLGARWSYENNGLKNEKSLTLQMMDRTVVLLLLAMLINPYGFHLTDVFVDHLVQLFHGPQIIEEWAAPTVRQNPMFWVLFVVSMASVLGGLWAHRREAKFWAPVVMIFAFWGARHQRNAVVLPFFALPFLIDLGLNWPAMKSILKNRFVHGASFVLGAVLIILLARSSFVSRPKTLIQENRFPMGACDFVKANEIKGTMYNTYQMGGYIEWALGDAWPVFMDGRYLFQPLLVNHAQLDDELFRDPDGEAWRKLLSSYGVDYAIVDYGPFVVSSQGRAPFPLAWANLVFPRSDWALVYWDDAALVFVKRAPQFQPLIESTEYRSLWPYNLAQMRSLLMSHVVSVDDVERELLRHREAVPFSVVDQEIEKLLMEVRLHVA